MTARRWAIAGTAVLLVCIATFAARIVWFGSGPAHNPASRADVALVLGAAVWDDAPSPVFAARIDHAIDLYRAGRVERIVFTGGTRSDSVEAESQVARAYARERGVPDRLISTETVSLTTAQNLACASALLDAGASVLLVSDPLHLWRANWMADDLGLDARASATPSTRYRSLNTQVPFLAREVWFSLVYGVQRVAAEPGCPEGR